MDGTLLDDNKEITSENIQAVHTLRDKGIFFVIATGRHDSMIRGYLDSLGVDMPVISCNGALIREPRSGELYGAEPMDSDQIFRIIRICKEYKADYHIYGKDVIFGEALTNKMYYYDQRNRTLDKENRIPLLVSGDYETFVKDHEGQLFKVLVLPSREEDFSLLTHIIFEQTGLEAFRSDTMLLDVMQKGTSKAKAIETLCRKLNIQRSETAAIGDYLNDLEMIRYAGTGVAMQNAVPELKKAAGMITEFCNNRSGVAEAIERLIS